MATTHQRPKHATEETAEAALWVNALLRWFDRHQRWMPWRECATPYRVWVSEIMLQQTQVAAVIPYFERFMAEFPTLRALARADLQEVLKAWQGLGYYARARHLHGAAQDVEAGGGGLPTSAAALARLPGVGAYTAAAIASICFKEAVPVVDGNVLRVFARFWGLEEDVRSARMRRALSDRLAPLVPQDRPGDFNQAIMELGAVVCRPRGPDCPSCPLKSACSAYGSGRVDALPVRVRRSPVPHYDIAVGIVRRRGRVLVARRRADAMLGGLWEFPGGKRRPGETLPAACRREIREETGLRVGVGKPLGVVSHAYSHFRVTLHIFACEAPDGRARALASDELRWCRPGELDTLPFPAANVRVIELIRTASGKWRRASRPRAGFPARKKAELGS